MTDVHTLPPINIENMIGEALRREIEAEVNFEMPKLVAAACARVSVELEALISYERMGPDLRIIIKNAYEEEKLK